MLAALAACDSPDQPYVARDPCVALAISAIDATSVQQDGIAEAQALWRAHGVAAFDGAPAASLEVRFADAASAFHGVYDPASDSVVINRGITDRATLAIVIAHELGHVFGLMHVASSSRVSLMNPGNLTTPPTDADQQTLEALWGTCE